jgi:uncharacterized protein (DUF2252 family)
VAHGAKACPRLLTVPGARQMDSATLREFGASFKRSKAARLDAPSWLWTSVVELAAAHEAAYLEHCRRFALAS